MLRYYTEEVVWTEIPGEVTISYAIAGCPLRCEGCSWQIAPPGEPKPLEESHYLHTLSKYQGLASCVLFLGGEWEEESLLSLLQLARERDYKTGLYTGLSKISETLKAQLDYLKTGAYVPRLGGLDSPDTNQRLIRLSDGACLNHHFLIPKKGARPETGME